MHSLYAYITSKTAGPEAKPATQAPGPTAKAAGELFGSHLDAAFETGASDNGAGAAKVPSLKRGVAAFFEKTIPTTSTKTISEQMSIYKEDQLLAHPGGDKMDIGAPDPYKPEKKDSSVWGRIKKDLGDAWANLKNLFKDLFFGSSYRYVDQKGQVQSAKRPGFMGRTVELVKDVASGLSFGLIRPEGEPAPEGLKARLAYAADKLFGEALKDDLVFGMPQVALNLVDDAVLAAWNLVETVPDATIGSLPNGDRFTGDMFDNGQVMIDFITDCLPAGEAWMRVHAYKLQEDEVMPPVLFNLKLPEHFAQDETWATVRNTDFRKSIETVGSIIPDIGATLLTQFAVRTSKRK